MDNQFPNKDFKQEKSSQVDDFPIQPITHAKAPKKEETHLIVLDYLPDGKEFGSTKKREPIIQAIGTNWFSLVELILVKREPYPQFTVIPFPKESSDNTHIKKIKHFISMSDLTNTSSSALEKAIEIIINQNEKRFVTFFNKAQPITNRSHALQLIPGIGKKLMWDIIAARKQLPFISFNDIEQRLKISDIKRMIANRIIEELQKTEKHRLFTIEPPV